MRKLKIAIFCTNRYPTPPTDGTIFAPIWVTSWIANAMAEKGHKVYLFASSESKTKAKLVSEGYPAMENNKKLSNDIRKYKQHLINPKEYFEKVEMYEGILISKMYDMAQKGFFDLVHIHPYSKVLPTASISKTPTLITLHDSLDNDFTKLIFNYYKKYRQIHFVSLSKAQRKPMPGLNYANTIYNGIEIKKYKFNQNPENYFLFAGRINKKKGLKIACEIAKRTGILLKIAGSVDKDYFEKEIKSYLKYKNIKYLGPIPYQKMPNLFQKAKCLLFPIQWEEPFGLVMIEAMACGTPVIGFNRGSVPEVIKDGKTGFVVNNAQRAVKAVNKIDTLKREECRKHVEKNFILEKMINEYEKTYYKIVKK